MGDTSRALKAALICLGVVCLASLAAIVLRPAPPSPPSPPPSAASSDLPGGGQGSDADGSHQGSGSGSAQGNAGDETRSPGRAGLLHGPGIALEQGRFVGRSGGEKRWEFDADQVLVREGETRVVVESIRDGVLYDRGQPWLRFSAARGEADTATSNLNLVLEDVRFSSKDGDVLTARKLTWSEKSGKVLIEGDIRVRRGEGSVLLCERAEYRPGDNVLEAVGRTTVEIELSGEDAH